MGIYKKGNVYWMIKQHRGKRVERSLDTDVRRIAEQRYAKIVTEIIDGSYYDQQRAASVTFSMLWERYKMKYQRLRDPYSIKHLLPVLGDKTLAGITSAMVEDFIESRDEAGAAAATIKNEYSLGRRMFNVARKKWKLVRDNPFADVSFSDFLTIDNKRDRVLSLAEEVLLLSKAKSPEYLRDLIIFALHTGCRRKEILSFEWRDVNFRERFIRVAISKLRPGEQSKLKTIPMSDTLFQTLLFRSKVQHISGKVFPVSASSVRQAFEKAVVEAKLDDFRFHDLRHSFASRLVQNGVDLYSVSKMMGHSTIQMTERYSHHSPASLLPCVKALDDYYNSTTVKDYHVCQKPE